MGASYYSEARYARDAQREVITSLHNIAASLQQSLRNHRSLSLGMARAPAVQALLPALQEIKHGDIPAQLTNLREQLNRYFEGFQTILPGAFYLRLLDAQGNTLVKVSHNKRSAAVYDSLSGIHYVEEEIQSEPFVADMQALPADEVSSIALPHDRSPEHLQNTFSLLDYIVPLDYQHERVGALAVTLMGGRLDRIMDQALRLYDGDLSIIENNPDAPQTHGQVIYDKQQAVYFSQIRTHPVFPDAGINWLDKLGEQGEGLLKDASQAYNTYYIEMSPYPDRLQNWILRSQINPEVIAAPFDRIRLAIWLLAASALFIALLVTLFTAQKLSRPIQSLAAHLKNFADGDSLSHLAEQQVPNIDEFRELARSFNYLVDTLTSTQRDRDHARRMALQNNKLASIGKMAAGIGHEINNPLNNILSYSKLIRRSLENTGDRIDTAHRQQLLNDINDIRSETLRASEIIKGLLNFARQLPPQYSNFKFAPWLHKTLNLVKQAAADKHIEIKIDNAYRGTLRGDELQLQQALINLLLNAIAASPVNASIDLKVTVDSKQLSIDISDQGPGINDDIRDKIFDPFFSTKAEGEGCGLGLSISLGIIERHQGILSLDNNPVGGSNARIRLPLQPTT